MSEPIKAGDVVQLVSGGSKMSVAKVFSAGGDTKADLVWEAPDGSHKTATYAVAALKVH